MRHLHLFKSCFWEGWYFDGSGQTTLLGSCYSFNLPSGCWGSNADKSSKPLQCYSDLSHMYITQWSGCVFSSQCLRHPDWDQIHRCTDPRVSPGFHKQLHEFIFPNSSLFVASLVLCLTGMPLFSSPVRKLEVYYAVCFLDCLCLGQMGAQKGKKKHVRFTSSSGDHSSVCWRGMFPSFSFKTLTGSVHPDVTAATWGLPRVWGVRDQRRGVKKEWGIYTLSEHTSFFFSENERASPVALSVLPAHLCVSGCIAFS